MSFEKFMEHVLGSAGAAGQIDPANDIPASSGATPAATESADAQQTDAQRTDAERFEEYLLERMDALQEEAGKAGHLQAFADIAAWKLATIGYRIGPVAIGNILRRFGSYLEKIDDYQCAQREAQAEAKAGRRLN